MEKEGRVTVGVEELALSNSISIVALVELLEEKGFDLPPVIVPTRMLVQR